jgi:hypothetical protein
MRDRFTFNDRRLLWRFAVIVAIAAPLCYFFDAWVIAVALGFGAMMFAGARGRERVHPDSLLRQSVSFPEPTQSEGSIAAAGVALWVAAAVAFIAHLVHPWPA